MEILFQSSWGLKPKLSLQNSESPLPLWVAAHLEIQPGTFCRVGQDKAVQAPELKKATTC